jgi:hypothetical protein
MGICIKAGCVKEHNYLKKTPLHGEERGGDYKRMISLLIALIKIIIHEA